MKQSLARITAWAKKHPWLAGAIVLGVIVLGYLVYKRSGGGGGSSGETMTAAELPESSTDVSPIPSMGDIPSPVTGGGSSSTPSSDLDISPSTGQIEPTSFPEFASTPPATAGEFGGGWVAPDLGETISASFAPPSGAVTETLQSAKGLGMAKASVTGTLKKEPVKQASALGKTKGGILGGKTQPEDVRPARQATGTTTSSGVIKKFTPKQTPKTRPGRTPAERLGLYWLYTGPYNGFWYSFGYPIGTSASASASGLSGGTLGGTVKTSTRPDRGR